MVLTLLLLIEIIVCLVGLITCHKIFKLINHGNAWWLMSLGFGVFLINNFIHLVAPTWYLQYDESLHLLARLAVCISAVRIYQAAKREHNRLLNTEKRNSNILIRLRELTNQLDDLCPFWSPSEGCQNPKNPDNKLAKE